jgi:Dullard-like phosphatase family protein
MNKNQFNIAQRKILNTTSILKLDPITPSKKNQIPKNIDLSKINNIRKRSYKPHPSISSISNKQRIRTEISEIKDKLKTSVDNQTIFHYESNIKTYKTFLSEIAKKLSSKSSEHSPYRFLKQSPSSNISKNNNFSQKNLLKIGDKELFRQQSEKMILSQVDFRAPQNDSNALNKSVFQQVGFTTKNEEAISVLDEASLASQYNKVEQINFGLTDVSFEWFSTISKIQINQYKNPSIHRYMVLDLDETLIHCSHKPLNQHSLPIHLENKTYFVHLRPYVKAFLNLMSKYFNLILYTASQKQYADKVLNLLDPHKNLFCLRLYRDSCYRFSKNFLLKSIQIIEGIDYSQTLILDNSLICFFSELSNIIPILSFFGNIHDQELMKISKYILDSLLKTKVMHFPTVLRKQFNLELLKSDFDVSQIVFKVLNC